MQRAMMRIVGEKVLWLAAAWCVSVSGQAGEITTNEALWRGIAAWRGQIAAGRTGAALAELEEVMRGPAQWRTPVLSGEGWAYAWGFLALRTHAEACEESGQPARAYRALANAFTYLPTGRPPAYAAGEYWRWHIAMGRVCAALGRTYDAQWYLQQARAGLATNDALYYTATAELAGVASRLGEYERAVALLDEVFAWNRAQPTRVWHEYIRLLFLCGRFEEGVAAILAGARANGFSPRFVERDYFIVDAARYWHFFSDADVLEWYDLLGDMLEKLPARRENERLIALLINTRTLMKQAHPELLALGDDDLQALRERVARETKAGRAERHVDEAGMASAGWPGGQKAGQRGAAQSPLDALACSVNAGAAAASNILLEDTVNQILHQMALQSKYSYGSAAPWLGVLKDFASNTLAEVYIDGVPAGWLAQAMLVTIYADEHRRWLATNWIERALGGLMQVNNATRMANLMLWVGDVHFARELRDLERIKSSARWAMAVAPSNQRVQVEAQSQLSGVALFEEGPQARAAALQRLVERHGCTLRQAMYERLARDYFTLRRPREAVQVLFEGIKRTPMKLDGGLWNSFVETLYCARSLLTVEELERYRVMLRSAAMRYPAVLENVAASANALGKANAPWVDEHLTLARIERAGVYGEAQWAAIFTAAQQRASVRAGAMYIAAQVAREHAATNVLDWRGWLAGWEVAARESRESARAGDAGVRGLLHEQLLEPLEAHEARMRAEDRRAVIEALDERLAEMDDRVVRERGVRLLERWGETNRVERLRKVWERGEEGRVQGTEVRGDARCRMRAET